MKKIIGVFATFITVTIISLGCSSSKPATGIPVTATALQQAINENKWTFTADYVMPQSGRSRATNGLYTMVANAGKILVQLPYFGRAYSGADVLSGKGPLNFTSSDFNLDKQEKKEGEWRLMLKPNDYREVQSMTMNFYTNGRASVDVLFTNHSPISFRGTINLKQD